MASLRELEEEGRTGFDPEWEYDGRAYRWRVKAGGRSWLVGLCFERAYDCERLQGQVSTVDWRRAITRNLRETDEEMVVEIVYKDYRRGEPVSRISVLKGTRYPVVVRSVRGGESRPTVLWSKGERYEKAERHPAPTESELLDAEIGMSVKWYVLVWSGNGWKHLASVTDAESKDAIVSLLKRRGIESYVVERKRSAC